MMDHGEALASFSKVSEVQFGPTPLELTDTTNDFQFHTSQLEFATAKMESNSRYFMKSIE